MFKVTKKLKKQFSYIAKVPLSQGREVTFIQYYIIYGSYSKLYNYPNISFFFDPRSNQGSLIIFDVKSL